MHRRRKKIMEDDEAIVVSHVTKSYPGTSVPALDDISFTINKGEFVFIVGPSGSGKSTLIKLLLRELVPTKGSIFCMNYDLKRIRHGRVPKFRRNIGVVFQDFRLLRDRNVYENVAFAQRIVETPGREIRKNVPRVLSTVGLAGKYRAKPANLSGGEQQRVAIARALVNKPSIILADEPTGNLDPGNTNEIMHLLEEINESGTTVIVVTHNKEIVNSMHKRLITLRRGVIISDQEMGVYIDED